jgi:hypothetical protein
MTPRRDTIVPDLCLDARRPFALVTTVRRSGPRATRVHPQLDLDLPGYTLRLRFADPESLALFSEAVDNLLGDAVSYCSHGEGNVRVRVLQPQPVQLELPY